MNEKMTDVAVGVALVVLAYALYAHFRKPAGAASTQFQMPARLGAQNPDGAEYNPAMPGNYVSADNLIYGAVTGQAWDAIPTTDDLIYATVYGDKPKPSSVILPGRVFVP